MVVRKDNHFSRSAHKGTTGRKAINSVENVEVEYRIPWPVLSVTRQDSLSHIAACSRFYCSCDAHGTSSSD